MFSKFFRRKLLGADTAAVIESALGHSGLGVESGRQLLGADTAAVIESALGHSGLGVESESDRKLLTDGLEAEGVITERRVIGGKGRNSVMGFYVAIEGHIKFDDGTEATFSSMGLDTSKLGDLAVGTIVPVRYDADRQHVVLDTRKLEAAREAETAAAAEIRERRDAESIAAADAELAQRDKSAHQK